MSTDQTQAASSADATLDQMTTQSVPAIPTPISTISVPPQELNLPSIEEISSGIDGGFVGGEASSAPKRVSKGALRRAAKEHAMKLALLDQFFKQAIDNPSTRFELLAKMGFTLSVGAQAMKGFKLKWQQPCCQLQWDVGQNALVWSMPRWDSDVEVYEPDQKRKVKYKAGVVRPQCMVPVAFDPFDNILILTGIDDVFVLDFDWPKQFSIQRPTSFADFNELFQSLYTHASFKALWDHMVKTHGVEKASIWIYGQVIQFTGSNGFQLIGRKGSDDTLGQGTGFLAHRYDGPLPDGYDEVANGVSKCTMDTRGKKADGSGAGVIFAPGSVVAAKLGKDGKPILVHQKYEMVAGQHLTVDTLEYLPATTANFIASTAPTGSSGHSKPRTESKAMLMGLEAPEWIKSNPTASTPGNWGFGGKEDGFILLAKLIRYIDKLEQAQAKDPDFVHPHSSRDGWRDEIMMPLAHTAAHNLGISDEQAKLIFTLASQHDVKHFDAGLFASKDETGQLQKAIDAERASPRPPGKVRRARTIHMNAQPWNLNDKACQSAMAKARKLTPDLAAKYDSQQAQIESDNQARVDQAIESAKVGDQTSVIPVSQSLAAVDELPIFKPEPPLFERDEAQSSSLTITGAVNRFPFIRNIAGKMRVMDLQCKESTILARDFPASYGMDVEVSPGNFLPIGKYLVDNRAARIEVDSVTFDPDAEPGVIKRSGREYWNLYNGLDMEKYPAFDNPATHCPLILGYLYDVLNHPDVDGTGYIFNYMAWCVQHHTAKSGVAIVLRGEKGSGKTTYNKLMYELFAPHSLLVSSSRHIFGDFNGHMEELLYVGLEEALWANNGKEEDGAKHLITGDTTMLEKKYVNAKEVKSYVNIGITTNHDHAAPVTKDERRYGVFDIPPGIYTPEQWKALYAEIKSNGVSALWQVLKAHQLNGWNPKDNIPQNKALAKQKLFGLGSSIEGWIYDLLQQDTIPSAPNEDWDFGTVEIVGKHGKNQIRDRAKDWQRSQPSWQKRGATFTDRTIVLALKKIGVISAMGGAAGKDRTWVFPDRMTCIDNFEKDQCAIGGFTR